MTSPKFPTSADIQKARPPFAHRQRGFNLLEVMVAMFVLAFGLLGLAALQVQTLRSNYSAMLRTQATFLAIDVTERIRAAGTHTGNTGTCAAPAGVLVGWCANVTSQLGETAEADVSVNGNRITVSVSWVDDRGCIRKSGGDCGDDGGRIDFDHTTEI